MSKPDSYPIFRAIAPAALAGLILLTAIAPASAAESWLSRAFKFHLGGHSAPAQRVVRYQIDTGGAFILDRSGKGTLLKFSDSPEVWVLSSARGPRGDMIFSNDLGQTFLRTTRFGGVTVFTRRHPEGAAAALEGPSTPLRLASLDAGQLFQRLALASARTSRAAGRLIAFQAPDTDAASSGVIADAAAVASEALIQLAATRSGRTTLARLSRVDFERGRSPGAAVRGSVIEITVAPKAGVLGRPSSARILRALTTPS